MERRRPNSETDPLTRHSLTPGELKELLAAERTGKPFLAYRDHEGQLALLQVGEETLMVGRRAEMGISIDWDAEVSGLHAELQCLEGEWAILDDGLSTNGTYVNGQRINGRQRLRDGDRIRVGRTVLVYRFGTPAQVPPTAVAAEAATLQELSMTQRRVLISLCRPFRDGDSFATPAPNQQIAEELHLSVDAVKMHMRALFGKFELGSLAQNEKRARLAECALLYGAVTPRDFD
jgi:FHA domain/Bacterial regulatory proteins, luxR family